MTNEPGNFSQALDELTKTKGKVEEQVKANPWATIGIVGLLCFVLGLLFAKGTSRKTD